MSTRITRTDEIEAGDLVILYKTSAGDYRGLPRSELLSYIQGAITFPAAGQEPFTSQYAVPSTNDFLIPISPADGSNVHLILTPTAGFTSGTLTLPLSTTCVDKQEILVNCTQSVSSFVVEGNGSAVTGEPSSLGADDFFRLKYDLPTAAWYRVG